MDRLEESKVLVPKFHRGV